jgi:hypothetical protein
MPLDEITAVSTALIAVFTIILALIAVRQGKDSRALNRAYIGVEPAGIVLWSDKGSLLGHFIIRNAGNLPAGDVKWVAEIGVDTDRNRTSFPVNEKGFKGDLIIPPRDAMQFGTQTLGLQTVLDVRDKREGCYLYVWGLVRYRDGFDHLRSTNFCHRYDYGQTLSYPAGQYELSADKGRYHSVPKREARWRRLFS